jgi:hypothetical protein
VLVLAAAASEAGSPSPRDGQLLAETARRRPGERTQSVWTRRDFTPALSNEGRLPASPQGACSGLEEATLAASGTTESLSQLQQAVVALPGGGFTGAFAASPLVSGDGTVHLVVDVYGYFN